MFKTFVAFVEVVISLQFSIPLDVLVLHPLFVLTCKKWIFNLCRVVASMDVQCWLSI
jgi:ABC-type uncharacterized transport system permease subunit